MVGPPNPGYLGKVLFVIPQLPRSPLSIRGISDGCEALSGSHAAFLLVAEDLARRGYRVGLFVARGERVVSTVLQQLSSLRSALDWVGSGRIILCSWGDSETLDDLIQAQVRPWVWIQVHVPPDWISMLERGALEALVVVSDAARLPYLHSTAHRRIGRVHNPLNPFFVSFPTCNGNRYRSQRVVFAGYVGETKGAHHVLRAWPHVRAMLPNAVLVIAGSSTLYGRDRRVGPFGVAEPQFERRYLQPIAERFGSLGAGGIELAGLLPPTGLRELYGSAALGLVNFNRRTYTETFCSAAVEMLATGLPVVSVAAGALPETIGRSGGARLMPREDAKHAARTIAGLLAKPGDLEMLGAEGRNYVGEHYRLDRIVDEWDRMLHAEPEHLEKLAGKWRFKRNARYWLERTTGHLRAASVLQRGKRIAQFVLRSTDPS